MRQIRPLLDYRYRRRARAAKLTGLNFEEPYELYRPLVLRIGIHFLGRDAVEDHEQQVFLRLLEMDQSRIINRPFIRKVAANEALKMLRTRRIQPAPPDEFESIPDMRSSSEESREIMAAVLACIQNTGLSDLEQKILWNIYLEQKEPMHVGGAIGVSRATVYRKLPEARANLRGCLSARGMTPRDLEA